MPGDARRNRALEANLENYFLFFLAVFFFKDNLETTFFLTAFLTAFFLVADLAFLAEDFFAFLTAFLPPKTMSLKSFARRNFATVFAGTFTGAPVAGFLAILAGRYFFSHTPNPAIVTLSPEATAVVMVSKNTSTKSSA